MFRVPVFRHIIVWAIFITYEIVLLHLTSGVKTNWLYIIIYYLLNIGLFYFNAFVILNYAFFKTRRSYLIVVLLTVAEIAVYLLIKLFMDEEFFGVKGLHSYKLYVLMNAWRGIYFIGLSIAYWSSLSFIRFRERAHQIEKQQLIERAEKLELENRYVRTENAYLQNQISPHLLFNSLNFIYRSVYKLSKRAGAGVMLLSELLRYSLVTAEAGQLVSLSEELLQVKQLLELNQLRFHGKLYIEYLNITLLSEEKIIPLVLVTLAENLIKHGDLSDPDNPGKISVENHNRKLHFQTYNKKNLNRTYSQTGLGLANINRRLTNAYQDNYKLIVTDQGDFFTVHLTLPI